VSAEYAADAAFAAAFAGCCQIRYLYAANAVAACFVSVYLNKIFKKTYFIEISLGKVTCR